MVSTADFDLVSSVSCAVADTAYNVFEPRPGHQFVTTALKIRGSKDVSNTIDATVLVYESLGPLSTTSARDIFSELIVRFESTTLAPINILINEGVYINAKTTEATATVTITGYFVPTKQDVTD